MFIPNRRKRKTGVYAITDSELSGSGLKPSEPKRVRRALWKFIGFILCFVILPLLVLLTLGILGTIGFGKVLDLEDKLGDTRRYCIYLSSEEVFEGSGGDPDSFGFGNVVINIKAKSLTIKFFYDLSDSDVPEALHIHGPTTALSPLTASIFIPSDASTIPLTPGSGSVDSTVDITTSEAKSVIGDPSQYYVLLKTANFTMGSIASRLGRECRSL